VVGDTIAEIEIVTTPAVVGASSIEILGFPTYRL
jgi:hypothetical protein